MSSHHIKSCRTISYQYRIALHQHDMASHHIHARPPHSISISPLVISVPLLISSHQHPVTFTNTDLHRSRSPSFPRCSPPPLRLASLLFAALLRRSVALCISGATGGMSRHSACASRRRLRRAKPCKLSRGSRISHSFRLRDKHRGLKDVLQHNRDFQTSCDDSWVYC